MKNKTKLAALLLCIAMLSSIGSAALASTEITMTDYYVKMPDMCVHCWLDQEIDFDAAMNAPQLNIHQPIPGSPLFVLELEDGQYYRILSDISSIFRVPKTLREYFTKGLTMRVIPSDSDGNDLPGAEETTLQQIRAAEQGISADGSLDDYVKASLEAQFAPLPNGMKFADCGDACSECEPDVCSCCKISEYDKLNDLLTCMRKKFSGLFILLNYWNTGKIDYETFSWTNWFK